jgi:flagellar basal body-associated protein FliL
MSKTPAKTSKKSSPRRLILSIAIPVVLVAAGGTFLFAKNAQVAAQKDIAACESYLVDLNTAHVAFTKDAQAQQIPDPAPVVKSYVAALGTAYSNANNIASSSGQVADGLSKLLAEGKAVDLTTDAKLRESFTNIDNAATDLQKTCDALLKQANVANPTQTLAPTSGSGN